MARARLVAIALASLIVTGAAHPKAEADEITEQLDLIDELYAEGEYGQMITELEFVLQDIRARMSSLYAETFPAPPDGWTADEAQNEAGAGFLGGTMVNRTYREEGGNARIEAQLMVDNPVIQGMAGLFANPQLLAAQPGAERIRIGRETAILVYDDAARTAEVTFMLGGRILLQLNGSGVESGVPVETLLTAWDLDELKRIAGI